jgi:hypothetical protein
MNTETAANPPGAEIESADARPDNFGIYGFASSPVLRLWEDGRIVPLAEVLFYGANDAVVLQRQLTVFQLTSIAEGLIKASAELLSTCQEQIAPKKGWVLPTEDIQREIAGIQEAIQSLQAQLRTFST